MYLKLTILLTNWKLDSKKIDITFVWNSYNIAHTMFLPNISIVDRILRQCLANATTKKVQENKLKLYQNLKKIELLKNSTKETSILHAIQKSRFKKFPCYGNAWNKRITCFSLIISKRPWRNWFGNIWGSTQWPTALYLPLQTKCLHWIVKTPP